MKTHTPRTDAATELYGEKPFMVPAVPVEFAEGLERELAVSKAEVKRLQTLPKSRHKAFLELIEASNLKAICDEQQSTLKFWGQVIEELRLKVIAARESEGVWKTERDKADQRRLEAEAKVERLKDTLNRTIAEIEKAPFHSPKLTAFIAEKYRDEMTNNSTNQTKN
jgi:hypothetical protein